ncbi:MAG: DUF975 family protein [Clostridiaceae bacterium]|nr:DUF975 family protein [Clostridiaceae bacterium]
MDYTPGRFHPTVTRPELKFRARMALTGRWGSAVLAMIVYLLLAMGCGMIPIIGTILLVPPLEFGLYIVFLKFYRENDTRLENLFSGFNMFGKVLAVYWLSALYVFLWSLLFVIPGIVASYRYSQAMLILYDNPEISASEAIRRSKAMMYGNKMTLFIQDLSFLGWFLLSIFPGFYIGFLWSMPYYYTTRIAFYEDLVYSAQNTASYGDPDDDAENNAGFNNNFS